jgi:hypothetical protein
MALENGTPTSEGQQAPATPVDSGAGLPANSGGTQQPAGGGQQSTPSRAVLEGLASRGLNIEAFENDDDLIDAFAGNVKHLQMLPQLQHLASAGREYLTEREQYLQWKASQKGQQGGAAPQKPEPKPDPWAPIQYEKDWDDVLTRDPETGKWVPKNPYINPEVAIKREQYDKQLADRARTLIGNPYEFLKHGFESQLAPKIKEMIQAEYKAIQEQQAAQSFVASNTKNWVATNEHGQPIIENGEEVLTPAGLHALQYAEQLAEIPGLTFKQREAMLQREMRLFELEQKEQSQSQRQAASQQQTPPPTPEEKKSSFLETVEARSRNGGSVPREATNTSQAAPATKRHGMLDERDWDRIARNHMAKAGLTAN